jgi:hypothetical protein
MYGLGLRVRVLGPGFKDSEFGVQGLGSMGCRVEGSGFGALGLGFGVWGLGFRASDFAFSVDDQYEGNVS